MSMMIPLGLDTTRFEAELKRAGTLLTQFSDKIQSQSSLKPHKVVDENGMIRYYTELEKAYGITSNMQGTLQKAQDNMAAMANYASALDLNTKNGKSSVAEIYNSWAQVRDSIGGASINFEKLYKMQKEYSALTGKEFKISNLGDMQNISKALADEKELIRLIKEEEDAKKKIADEQERIAKKDTEALSKATLAFQKKEKAEIESLKRAQRKADIQQAINNNLEEEKLHQQRLAAINQKREYNRIMENPRSIDDYNKKISYLSSLQQKLNITTTEGQKKYREYQKEINRTQASIENVTGKKQALLNVMSQVHRQFGAMFGLAAITQFVRKVAEVGGELEKQKVALGAIVQDISKANVLFSQLQKQALESPFTFRNLIDGTRMLAAYNIEAEKLYDTQFMLTELSAGLGVEMSRLTLAYGQVKAASVLRGQELRQFTEAGIPLVQALADKFSALEGRVVSTGEVFEKISRRMVSFQMVSDVLSDMTEEGGKFYKMQEKQAETIAGQLSNIKDAQELMFMDMAKNGEGAILAVIKFIRYLIDNWRTAQTAMEGFAIGLSAYMVLSAAQVAGLTGKLGILNKALMSTAKTMAILRTAAAGAIGVVVAGLVLIGSHLYQRSKELDVFKEKIEGIGKAQQNEMNADARRLNGLIEKLGKATAGSAEYKEIREQIITQYGKYFPRIIKETDGVKELADMYGNATSALKSYYAEKARMESEEALKADRGILRQQGNLVSNVGSHLSTMAGVPRDVIKTIMQDVTEKITSDIYTTGKLSDTYQNLIRDAAAKQGLMFSKEQLNAAVSVTNEFDKLVENLQKRYNILSNVNDEQFNALSAQTKKGLQNIKDAYTNEIKAIQSDETLGTLLLSQALKIDDAKVENEARTLAYSAINTIQQELAKAGKRLGTGGENTLLQQILSGAPSSQFTSNKVFGTIVSGAAERVNQLRSGASGGTLQVQLRQYYKEQEDGLRKEWQALDKNNKSQVDSFNARQNAIIAIRNQTMAYQSLSDAYALNDTEKELAEGIKRTKAQLEATNPALFIYADLVRSIKADEAQLAEIQRTKKVLGVTETSTSGGSKANEEPERLRRVTALYKELFQSYEKYAEYKDAEWARQQTINELQAEFNELNKEMGGRLGTLGAITTEQEYIAKLEQLASLAKTKDGKSVLQRLLIEAKGGQLIGEAKKNFDVIKEEAENLVSKLSPEFTSSLVVDSINEIIKRLSSGEFSEAGKALAKQLSKSIADNTTATKVFGLGQDYENAQAKRNLASQFESLRQETGVDLSVLFAEDVMDFDSYINELYRIKDAYRASDLNETQKAAEIEREIMKLTAERTIYYATETAKLNKKYGDKETIGKDLQARSENILKETERVEKLISETTNAEELKRYQIYLKYLQMRKAENDDLIMQNEADTYAMTEMYKRVYGDIEKFGKNTYRNILKSMKAQIGDATVINKGQSDERYAVSYNFIDENGVEQQEKTILNAKEYQRLLNSIATAQRKLKGDGNLNQAIEGFGTMFGAEGGAKFDAAAMGAGIQGVAGVIGELSGLLDTFGASQYAKDMFEGIGGGLESIGRIAANPADIGAYVKLIQSWVKVFDADNSKRIVEHGKAIEYLDGVFSDLEKHVGETIGLDAYQANMESMLNTIDQQIARYNLMIKEEKDKKGTNRDEIDKYQKSINDLIKKRNEELQKQVEEFSITVQSAADSFTSAWMDAFMETGNGMSAFEQSFDDMMKGIIKKQISTMYVQAALAPMIKEIQKAVSMEGEGGIAITKDEIQAILAAKGISKSFLAAGSQAMEDLMKAFGIGGSMNYDTLQKGIQGITESSAQIIASYLNSVRLDVHLIRLAVESRSQGVSVSRTAPSDPTLVMSNLMTEYYPQYLTNIIAIRENTNYLRDAYNPSTRAFRVS